MTRRLLSKITVLKNTLQKTSIINNDNHNKIFVINDNDHLKSFAEIFAISTIKIIRIISSTTTFIIIFKIDSVKNININYNFENEVILILR